MGESKKLSQLPPSELAGVADGVDDLGGRDGGAGSKKAGFSWITDTSGDLVGVTGVPAGIFVLKVPGLAATGDEGADWGKVTITDNW